MLEDQFSDPLPRPKFHAIDWSDVIRMQQGGENLTRMSIGLRFGYRNGTAPICPFTLQDADHAGWIGGQSSHSVEAAVPTPPDVFPDLIRMLKLEKGHAEVLKSTRSHEVGQSPLYFDKI